MQPSDFGDNKSGELIKTPRGYWAFTPNPLPPQLSITWELAGEISAADRALSELAGVARTLPNPHLLIHPFVRREAVLSSRIEGTQASLSDLFFFEASILSARVSPDVRDVVNYIKALEYGLSRLAELPICTRLFREMHALLIEDARGDHLTPGELRTSQNWIGPPGCVLSDATFVPPPVLEMNTALGDLEKFINNPSALPPLVRLALIHYQFEAIHPFLDGNGRIGRLLITLLLCSEGLLPQPLLYLSAYFERYRREYYQHLLGVSQRGLWTYWITFFLRGIATQSRDAIRRTTQLLDLQKEYRGRLLAERSPILTLRLMESLFHNPVITLSEAAKRIGSSSRTAQLTLNRLIELNILTESTHQARNRIYLARRIIDTVDAQEASSA